jgi:AraC-like DNA-binding protein
VSYEATAIAQSIRRLLMERPSTRLREISTTLGVERHTATRCLLRVFGTSFRQLQSECLVTRREALRQQGATLKEIAFRLGYSSAEVMSKRYRHSTGILSASVDRK